MTDNHSTRELQMKFFHQLPQCFLLRRCPGVISTTGGIKPTLIADTDGMPVMPNAVSTHFFDVTTLLDSSVTSYHEMIADTLPVRAVSRHPAFMPVVDVFGGTLLPRTDSRAMKYD